MILYLKCLVREIKLKLDVDQQKNIPYGDQATSGPGSCSAGHKFQALPVRRLTTTREFARVSSSMPLNES
jgi:hypothetical protein